MRVLSWIARLVAYVTGSITVAIVTTTWASHTSYGPVELQVLTACLIGLVSSLLLLLVMEVFW